MKTIREWKIDLREKPPVATPVANNNKQRLACVFLRLTERDQYAGVIEGNQKIYVVSDFRSYCQPKKNGWYFCLTPEREQKPLFISDGKPVYVVKILSAITGWKSSVNSMTTANNRSLSPNDLFETEPAVLLFEECGDYFIRIKDSDERKRIARKLRRREKETTGFENPWTEKRGFIFSPNEIVGSSLDKEEIISIIFG